MARYTVVESKHWEDKTGRRVSIYGALPWLNDWQKTYEGWRMVTVGYTVADSVTNTVGIGRKPWTTREKAQAVADRLNKTGMVE